MRVIERSWFNYPVCNFRVIDGDTIRVVLDLGFYLRYEVSLRLIGCDTPEIRYRSSRAAGRVAKAATEGWLVHFYDHEEYQLMAVSSELSAKYHNRTLGDFVACHNEDHAKQYSLSEFILKHKLARAYSGKTRKPTWSGQQLRAVEGLDVSSLLAELP